MRKKEKKINKENSRELQKANLEAEVYNRNKNCGIKNLKSLKRLNSTNKMNNSTEGKKRKE